MTILALNLSRKGENQKSKSIEKGLSIGREAPTALPVPDKADSILKPTQSIAPTKNITNKSNCRFPENGTNGELRICKVVKRVNANNHIVYDVYPPFDDLNKFAIVLWNNDTAEFFYEGTRYEATTSALINQFIKITATNADYSFSFIPKPHN